MDNMATGWGRAERWAKESATGEPKREKEAKKRSEINKKTNARATALVAPPHNPPSSAKRATSGAPVAGAGQQARWSAEAFEAKEESVVQG